MKRIPNKLLAGLLLIGALFTIGAGVRALSIRFTKFSDNLGYNGEFAIDGDYVVWIGLEEGYEDEEVFLGQDVFLYEISIGAITNLTDGENEQAGSYPKIAGDYVIWDLYVEEERKVYFHQISKGTTKSIGNGRAADLNEEYVVYYYGYPGEKHGIMLYDIAADRSIQIVSDTGFFLFAQVDGDYVVWGRAESQAKITAGMDFELYLYQISSGVTKQITNNTVYDGWPEIEGDYVVWYGGEIDAEDVYLYQISTDTTKKLTDDQTEDGPPKISGNNIVWSSWDIDQDVAKGIFLYQISEEHLKNISPGDYGRRYSIQIDGNNIVWGNSRGDFLYQIESETITCFFSSEEYGYYLLDANHIAGEYSAGLYEGGMFVIELNEVEEPAVLPASGVASGQLSILPSYPSHNLYTSIDEVLRFPFYGVEIPLVDLHQFGEGWNIGWLSEQAGWLTGSTFPVWTGNLVLTGRALDVDNQPGPFALLHKLEEGDDIEILADRQIYTYRVFESKAVVGEDIKASVLSGDRQWITLFTSEYYDPDEEEYISRWMVKAKLVSVERIANWVDPYRNVPE